MASFVELSNLLSHQHLASANGQPCLGLTAERRLKRLEILKSSLRKTFFSELHGPLQAGPRVVSDDPLTIWDKLHVHCAERRLQGHGEEAAKLEEALRRLAASDASNRVDVERVLVILGLLAGSGKDIQAPLLGHQPVKLRGRNPSSKRQIARTPRAPGILYTNQRREEESEQYTEYSRDSFKSQHCSRLSKDDGGTTWGIDAKVLKAKPGSTLCGLFNQDISIHDRNDYDRVAKRNLFGALVQSSVDSLHAKLRLPELPGTNIPEFLGIRPPSAPSSDEGFESLPGSCSSSVLSTPEKLMAPWRAAQDFKLNKHKTWDDLGQPEHKKERPYLTEAGPGVFDILYENRRRQAGIMAKQRPPDVRVFPDQRELCRSALNVLLGLPSAVFLLNRATLTFTCNPHCRLSGTSTESFQAMIQFFAEAGTDHARLTYLTQPEVIDSFYRQGLILQAFLGSVRRFLSMYQSAVMGLASESGSDWTLLKIRVVYAKLVASLRDVARLCGCDTRQGSHPGDDGDPLPTGIKLITYLYQKGLDCPTKEQYLIHLSMLRDSCGPYLMFIQDWSFHGICNDLYGEFMIAVNNAHIFKRDKFYWTQGYKMRSSDNQATAPLFMGAMATDIFLCGKSINLLKLCCPGHFICNVDMATPRLTITFSSAELEESHQRTTDYSREMTILARRKTITRQQKEAEEKRAKEELAVRAHQDAIRGMEKIKGNIRRRLEAADAKKRRIFQELKEQMQQELLRKTTDIAAEKKSDRERMDALTLREESEATLETELEKKAKEELIAYYEALTEGARHRERRALWRVSRKNLNGSRWIFLRQQEEQLLREMSELSKCSEEEPSQSEEHRKNIVQKVGEPSESSHPIAESVDHIPEQEKEISANQGISTSSSSVVDNLHGDIRDVGGQSQFCQGVPDGAAALDVPLGKTIDGQGSNLSEVVFSANQDIEPTLDLLGSPGSAPFAPEVDGATGVLIDLRDFLPKEGRGTPEDERAKDTSVEDTLLEIGSVLPEPAASAPSLANGGKNEGRILAEAASPAADMPKDEISKEAVGRAGVTSSNLGMMVKSDSADSGIGRSAPSLPRYVSESDIKGLLYPTAAPLHQKSEVTRSHPDILRPHPRTVLPHPEGIGEQSGAVQLTGHASDSSIQTMIYPTTGAPITDSSEVMKLAREEFSSDGLPSDASNESEAEKLIKVSQTAQTMGHAPGSSMQGNVPTHIGHASDSTIQTFMYQKATSAQTGPKDHETTSSWVEHKEEIELTADPPGIRPAPLNTTGHDSSPVIQDSSNQGSGKLPSDMEVIQQGTIGGHALDSKIQDLMYQNLQVGPSIDKKDIIGSDEALERKDLVGDTRLGGPPLLHPLDSTAQGLMYPDQASSYPKIDEGGLGRNDVKSERRFLGPVVCGSSGHPSDSTVQQLMYTTVTAGTLPKPTVPGGLSGHPSDSTAQMVMYGKRQAEEALGQDKPEENDEGIDEEMFARWQAEMDQLSFDFSVLSNPPTQDILAATGYMPSRSEVGDYCTQRIYDGNIDALDRLALPVLLERSITAPLTAQIKIVNESILDYFHVELKIGNLFQNLRRYLFLEGGEFGQCLCDQLFDKLSSAVHLHELLSPISLNHILSKAVQYSGDESSDINKKLSFACAFLPKVFKPNALEILDCLELKYSVDWPSNIVVTDSCLGVYNRVFLFLLKLKRTAWVLKDITHQLERSAKAQNASSSPQYHQLQIFRHEMQHFVSVMQSYVVNQVIHVSWEEFQQNLRHNVQNLDDLRSQHAKYLESAMNRCLLNKKAAPVMKVITDILSLVLKVRTQLMCERWREDPDGRCAHPNFRNMKNLYAAFKEYATFLFKVVSKMVTRGYQPHLEEFLMLLNFNNYYQDSGSVYPHS